ncbi:MULTISPECIES: alpha/beta hydrolase [Streptomyces]|uniref:alpha/beta hydrolase n=1 Tax=Streptomyces TaxID=1883 RepID=UPI00207ABB7A|nr:alpha/beta hydrolase fold domain-containing protein [Streptomyces spororaveus]MCM9078141.1 alpha/beta hydrolase [Streptomyces spororaveus]
MATPTVVSWEQVSVPTPSGPLAVRVFRPGTATPRGWLVWAHGGSWRAGSAQNWHGATAELARDSGFGVMSVDYRLAPDVRHPAMVEDVLSALTWAGEQRDGPVGGPPVLAVGGDSAGGTLAASAALVCRDRGMPLAAQVLAYPPLDPGCAAASYHRFPDMFPTASYLRAAWQDYRQPGRPVAADGTRLHSTPFEAADLRGLAPAVMATGDLDPVSDDVHRYGRLLRAAGVRVALREFRQTGHGAFLQPGRGPGGHPAASLRGWLAQALHRFTSPDDAEA